MRALNYSRECWLFTEKYLAVVEWQCFEEWQTLTEEGIQCLVSCFRYVRLICGTQIRKKHQMWSAISHDSTLRGRDLKRSSQMTSGVIRLSCLEVLK